MTLEYDCEHTFSFDNESSLRRFWECDPEKHMRPTLLVAAIGSRWQVLIYPHGASDETENEVEVYIRAAAFPPPVDLINLCYEVECSEAGVFVSNSPWLALREEHKKRSTEWPKGTLLRETLQSAGHFHITVRLTVVRALDATGKWIYYCGQPKEEEAKGGEGQGSDGKKTAGEKTALAAVEALKKRMDSFEHQMETLTRVVAECAKRLGVSDTELSKEKKQTAVEQWLASIDCSAYKEAFAKEGLDRLLDLQDLNEEDLIELGVDRKVHRMRILRGVAKMAPKEG